MADPVNEKEEILERLPEWYRILRDLYIKKFANEKAT